MMDMMLGILMSEQKMPWEKMSIIGMMTLSLMEGGSRRHRQMLQLP